uniref:Uncharacterized protein n=1 Tax=Tetranychus urticae TaxID=32264 RepID=T1JQI5_TETUR
MPQDLQTQELQAKLMECLEELKIYQRNEKQMEILTKENKQLQNEKLCLREALQRTFEKMSCLEHEKDLMKSHLYAAQLTEEAAGHEIKKLHSKVEDLRKENAALKADIEDGMISKKELESQILELKKASDLSEELASTRRQALEEQIAALKKVNNKLQEMRENL